MPTQKHKQIYLYSAGTQHGNLHQLSVTTSRVTYCILRTHTGTGIHHHHHHYHHHHHHHHQSLNREGRWGTTDDFATSFFLLFLSTFSTALWNLANSRPVHSLMLSSHLFLCLPCLLHPFAVPCKMVLARTDERET